jgi:outer membrane protein OmpA-like peptidoglycan-associated protein
VNKKLIGLAAGAAVSGGLLGFVARGGGDAGKLKDDVAELEKKQTASKERADDAEKERDRAQKARVEAEAKLKDAMASQKELADKVADNEKKSKETAAASAKLRGAIDKSSGSVSAEGDEIHLKLVDRVLFKTGDDQLTDGGKKVLDKLAGALKDMPDKQIWVQGHTDDQPIFAHAPRAEGAAAEEGRKPRQRQRPPRSGSSELGAVGGTRSTSCTTCGTREDRSAAAGVVAFSHTAQSRETSHTTPHRARARAEI